MFYILFFQGKSI